MRFCNNCGNKMQDHVNFCTECGVRVGTVINNKVDSKNLQGNIHNQNSTHNGVDIDLHDIRARHANNKGCLNIFLWVLFFPIMLISLIIKTDRFNKNIKILLIIGALIVSVPHISSYISILVESPQLILILAVIFFIYRYKKKREAKNLEARRIKEEVDQLERERKDEVVNKILDAIFSNKEMSSRLKEFILQHTKKYDNDQIDYSDYLKKIDMFLIYTNSKTGSEMRFIKDNYTEEIIKYWGENQDIIVDRDMIEKFINGKKLKIYSDDMKNIINAEDYDSLEDVVKEYVGVFGENSLKGLNLEILSISLDEDYNDLYSLVNEEYTKIKKEYEMRKLEGQLFRSDATFKGMEYIDSLSGFEFEDYLEELFTEFGYTTKELPYSNDYGADLIISKGFNVIVIQAKNYSANVGNKAVQEVIAAKSHYKSDIGMVITNAYYTQNAIKTAEASEIILVDRDGLERIISEGSIYFNSLVS